MNDKPKLVILRDAVEIATLIAASAEGALDAPTVFKGMCTDGPQYACDAEQLRVWRASQSTSCSEPK